MSIRVYTRRQSGIEVYIYTAQWWGPARARGSVSHTEPRGCGAHVYIYTYTHKWRQRRACMRGLERGSSGQSLSGPRCARYSRTRPRCVVSTLLSLLFYPSLSLSLCLALIYIYTGIRIAYSPHPSHHRPLFSSTRVRASRGRRRLLVII